MNILPATPQAMLYKRLDAISFHIIKESVKGYEALPESAKVSQEMWLDRIAPISIKDLKEYIYNKENNLIIGGN